MSSAEIPHVDWTNRRALERRMRAPVFRELSRAMAFAIVQGSPNTLIESVERTAATTDDFLLAARCHGVAAHLLMLADQQRRAFPDAVLDGLIVEAERIEARSVRLADDLRMLGHVAARAGVPFVPLKGSYLAWQRYARPALRPCADIDLLVRPGDMSVWRRELVELGYASERRLPQHVVFARPEKAVPSTIGDHPGHPRPVEVHERIADRVLGTAIDITALYWNEVEAGTILGDIPALLPRPVALALHLVLHSARNMLDRGLRLAQLLDLQFVDESPATLAAVRGQLGEVGWAVNALATRDAPGLLKPAVVAALDAAAPSRWRRRVVLSRPGLLTGDPYRLGTLTGELLLTGSPLHVGRRVLDAWSQRASSERGDASGPIAYLNSVANYLGLPWRRGRTGE
jgi:hypothetical protein